MKVIKLEDTVGNVFEQVVKWNYNWWGVKNKKSEEEVRCTIEHSVNTKRLPQTFVAMEDGVAVGMYQLSMCDDLVSRPDIYPWLINVYVDENHRNKGVCAFLMNTVKENAKKADLTELYLYTHHVGLYEKFGWEFVEEVKTFDVDSPIERLYKLKIV